ncbi:MAG TPA: phosphatase PAP2 family protein [Minicystis sp.]|nr:phosphatase PAP2 family protein [Minicystis sp.]
MTRVCAAAFALALACVATPGLARADAAPPGPRVETGWDPAWAPTNGWDYALASVAGAATAVEVATLQWRQAPLRWEDPILFDTAMRSALRLSSPTARDVVSDVSWGLLGAQVAYPFVVDLPYAWSKKGPDLAWELFWEDAETMLVASSIDFGVRDLAGRARPDVWACLRRGGRDCVDSPEAVRSFPGGHFLNSTTASVLTCTQHLYLHLYGGSLDAWTCALTLTSNAAVGVMRIMADDHWATDELAGGAIGALIGWGVPYFMHYRARASEGEQRRGDRAFFVLPTPMAFEGGGGVGLVGIF